MNETLACLKRLQAADLKITSVKTEIEGQPGKLETIAAKREAALADVKESEARIESLDHARREQESDLQLEGERLKKYKTQLNQVKTNKEYTAMLHEIETTETKIGNLEEQILIAMEEADKARERLAELKEATTVVERACREEEARIRARTAEAEGELAAAQAERSTLTGEIEAETLRRYEQIRERRRGVAVAPARKGLCGACGVELPPQLYNELFQEEGIHTCPGCQRILYVEPDAEGGKA